MPTTYTDQFLIMDPFDPPPVGTFLAVVTFDLIDNNDDGDVDAFNGDSVDGSDVTNSYPGDTVTLAYNDGSTVTYTGITFYLADGRQVFTPTDGQILSQGTLDSASAVDVAGPLDVGDMGPPCFAAGTLIRTPDGERLVDELCVGDLIETVDHGPQAIRWIGQRRIDGSGVHAPIRIEPNVMGNDRPLLLSPQHRVLLSGWRAEIMFGEDQVLVAAKHLVNDKTIRRSPMRHVTYYHFMFDEHELVWSDGCITESFFPGDPMLAQDEELRDEISAIFPELLETAAAPKAETARLVVKRFEAQAMQAA